MNNLRFSKAVSFLTGGVVLSTFVGCNRVSNASFSDSSVMSSISSTTVDSTSNTMSSSATTDSTSNTMSSNYSRVFTTVSSTVTSYVASSVNSFLDDEVIGYFDSLGKDVKSSFNSPDFLDKGKLYFVTCVDFLFYDGSINGVKFSDMTDMARSQLISDISAIDDLICSKYPNYKECISYGASSIYDKAGQIIKSGSNSLSDYSREKLGEENYSNLEQYKDLFIEQTSRDWDSFKDIIGDAYSYGKSKVKSKYEDFRGQ